MYYTSTDLIHNRVLCWPFLALCQKRNIMACLVRLAVGGFDLVIALVKVHSVILNPFKTQKRQPWR